MRELGWSLEYQGKVRLVSRVTGMGRTGLQGDKEGIGLISQAIGSYRWSPG